MYEYFYGEQSNQFSFYRIPKILFTDENFKNISSEAKILYGILLDRMSLSQKNGWTDDCGRVYIVFTVEEIMSSLGCQNQKVNKLMYELEKKCGLIERKRQGLGKPNLIYVKNFINNSKSQIKKCENHTSGNEKNTNQEMLKSHTNNTDINNTDFSDTDNPFLSETDEDERAKCKELIKDNIEYEFLIKNYPYDTDTINEMLELILDTVCSKRQYIRIAGDDKPHSVVKSQLLKITSEHISYCIDCLKESNTEYKSGAEYSPYAYNKSLTADQAISGGTMSGRVRFTICSLISAMLGGHLLTDICFCTAISTN